MSQTCHKEIQKKVIKSDKLVKKSHNKWKTSKKCHKPVKKSYKNVNLTHKKW